MLTDTARDTAPDVACVCVCAYARLPHRDLKHDSPIVVEGVVGVVLLMTPPLHDCRLPKSAEFGVFNYTDSDGKLMYDL